MRSFKHYGQGQEKTAKAQENEGGTAAELTKKLASAWNGKSSGDMWMQILAEAERGKKNGTLTNAEIDGFYEQFSPLLDAAQKRRLKGVVEKLKRM